MDDLLLEGAAARLVSRVNIRETPADTSADEEQQINGQKHRRNRRYTKNAMEIDNGQSSKKRRSRKNTMDWDKKVPESGMDADDENSDVEKQCQPNPRPPLSRPSHIHLPSYLRIRIDDFLSNNNRELRLSCASQYSDVRFLFKYQTFLLIQLNFQIFRYIEQKRIPIKIMKNGKTIVLQK